MKGSELSVFVGSHNTYSVNLEMLLKASSLGIFLRQSDL